MSNITFRLDGYKMNFRVAALISHNDRFLLAKTNDNNYHSLVGGRVETGEDSFSSVKRELEEEIGSFKLKEEIKLINISENFFIFKEEKVHELLFIFKVVLDDCELTNKDTTILKWINRKDITNILIQPKMIKEIIDNKEFSHKIINELENL